MKVVVTYLVHSCFIVELDDKVMLFDYPGSRFYRENMDDILRSKLKGREALIFSSHSHGDHFSPDVFKFEKMTSFAHFILSSDITFRKSTSNVRLMDPGEEIKIGEISIETYESNDAGVAFMIRYRNKTIYYGGDLAKWNWPEWSSAKRNDHVKVFEEVLKRLEKEGVDIAFSNMDERLESWAGPLEFIRSVKPRYFVPMHTFGNEGWIDDLVDENVPSHTIIFEYDDTGDSVEWDI